MQLDPVQLSIVTRWLPLAAVLLAIAIALIGSQLTAGKRRGHLRWAAAPVALLVVTYVVAAVAPGEGRFRLAELFLLFIVASATYACAGLWLVAPRLTDRRVALLLAMTALAVFLAIDPYHRGVQPTQSDEPHYLLITQSLVLDGDLDLANDYAGDRYRSFYEDTLPDVHAIQVGPHFYPIRDLGLPVLSVPFFTVGGRLGVMVLVSLAGAALVAQLYLLLRDLAIAARTALTVTALLAFLHPFLTYASAEIEPELFAALLFVIAVRALRNGPRTTPRLLAIASGCAGLIGIFTTRGWFIALGLGLVIAVFALAPRADLVRRVLAGAVPFAVIVLAISWVDCLMFPFGDGSGRCYFIPSAGYYLIRDQQTVLSAGPLAGAAGLLFDRAFGLISHAPIYLLAFAGIVPLFRRWRQGHGAELAALLIGGGLLIAYISDIAYWWADGMPASRYLVAPLPLLVVLVALGVEALSTAWRSLGWLVVAALAVPSAAVTALYTLQPVLGYDLAVDIQHGAPAQLWFYVRDHWGADLGGLWPSLVSPADSTAALVGAWLGVGLVLALTGAWTSRRRADLASAR